MPPTPSFGRLCATAIFLARETAQSAGDKFTLADVTRIIDQLDEGRLPSESTQRPQSSNPSPLVTAEDIYQAYPRKIAKKAAIKAITLALKTENAAAILEKTKAYKLATDKWTAEESQFIPHPATWFNRGSYADDPKEWDKGSALKRDVQPTNYSKF